MILQEISVVDLANVEFVDVRMVLLLLWGSGRSCTLLGPSTRTIWNQDFVFIVIDHLSMHLRVWYIRVEELAVILRSEVHLVILIIRMMYVVFSLTIEV